MIDINDRRYRIDDLQTKGYTLCQDSKGFCFGVDSVLLSYFASLTMRNNSNIVDLGTGNGIIPILLFARNNTVNITGIEIDERSCELARLNVLRNNLEKNINIINADFRKEADNYNKLFDAVVTNPPYIPIGSGACSPNISLAQARHEVNATLNDVLISANKLLKDNGRFYIVHRAARTVEIISKMKTLGLEPKKIQFVHSAKNDNAFLVLIEAHKASKENVIIAKPIILYDENGQYTKEINEIYGR